MAAPVVNQKALLANALMTRLCKKFGANDQEERKEVRQEVIRVMSGRSKISSSEDLNQMEHRLEVRIKSRDTTPRVTGQQGTAQKYMKDPGQGPKNAFVKSQTSKARSKLEQDSFKGGHLPPIYQAREGTPKGQSSVVGPYPIVSKHKGLPPMLRVQRPGAKDKQLSSSMKLRRQGILPPQRAGSRSLGPGTQLQPLNPPNPSPVPERAPSVKPPLPPTRPASSQPPPQTLAPQPPPPAAPAVSSRADLPPELAKYLDVDGDGIIDPGKEKMHAAIMKLADKDGDGKISKKEYELIKEKIEHFDADSDGKISYLEFQRACQRYGKNMSRAKLKQIFQKFDKDGSGEIDLPEFLASNMIEWKFQFANNGLDGYRNVWGHENEGDDRMFASEGDRSKHAQSENELMHIQKSADADLALQMAKMKLQGSRFASGTQLVKAFEFFDKDKSGTLSRDEIGNALRSLNIPVSISVVNQLVDYFDKDGSGEVNYYEFLNTFVGSVGAKQSIYKRA